MLWIDIKYANLIGHELERFKIVSNSPYIACYRCPICGDSVKKKRKTRGYLLEKENKIMSYCHNCGASFSLKSFLKLKSSRLFNDYQLECLKERGCYHQPIQEKKLIFPQPQFKKQSLNLGVPLSKCHNHPVLQYAQSRKIPEKFYSKIFAQNNILNITSNIEKYKNTQFNPTSVLVIPFYDLDQHYDYLCCRSIDNTSSFRYTLLELNQHRPNLWGLDIVDWTLPVYVFEGVLDAMMIPNSLAMSGTGSLNSIWYITQQTQQLKNICFIYDNELFKNQQILNKVKTRIKQGFSVIIYDKYFLGKDANEIIVQNKMTSNELLSYYQSRTFAGLNATLELAYQSKFY